MLGCMGKAQGTLWVKGHAGLGERCVGGRPWSCVGVVGASHGRGSSSSSCAARMQARGCCLLFFGALQGTQASAAVAAGTALPWGFALANLLVFSNVRRALGLGRCRATFSGAAPLRPDVHAYFASLFLPLHNLYGLSECTGPHAANLPQASVAGSCGRPLPGCETRLAPVAVGSEGAACLGSGAGDVVGDGEVCVRGRHVFLGYLRDPEATAAVMTPDGFLRTGDVGHVDAHGFLWVTGRAKELIITSGGVCGVHFRMGCPRGGLRGAPRGGVGEDT